MSDKSIVPFSDSQDNPQDKLAPYRKYVGLDLFAVMFNDLRLRPTVIDGVIILSLVSLMELFADKSYHPYQAWQDHKKRVLKRRPQLKGKIFKLALVAKDGKLRETEAADLSTCIKVLFAMNTPTAIEFQDMVADRIAHVTEAELNYRLLQISQGAEWAADTNHAAMLRAGAFDESAAPDRWQDIISGGSHD